MPDAKSFLEQKYGAENVKYLGQGSDSVAFRANGYVFRFTSKDKRIYQREADICAFLAPHIKSAEIPNISVQEQDGLFFAQHKMLVGNKWSWHKYSWHRRKQNNLARSLAQFLAQLHSVNVAAARKQIPDIDGIAEYVDFADVAPIFSKFMGKRMMRFFERKYNQVLSKPIAESDMVIVHMGVKGANSVCDENGNLCGVYDFGNCGVYERSRDFVLLYLGRNRKLYDAVVKHYRALTGVQINRRRVMDLASIEFMWKKRWLKDGRIQQVKRDYFIRKNLAMVIVNFCRLPIFFWWRACVSWMGIFAFFKHTFKSGK